ncbi:zinc-dependent metalloprotease [Agromyces protaetiae]|uniref:Zinc-dependent metalloprotease n=1 Tax=Agromyces protaetiae TaxID=2509455 RepID=A0A4P6FEX7_9MICO|nr:zinc-dependent metalloprotease [Agromyces protaetiae]QAY73593.1 zinc-dependent metalloprotease [Agromyces protaetiae]
MADRDDTGEGASPEDEFRDMFREFLSGSGGMDAANLAKAAGLPNDPAALQAIFSQLQHAMANAGDGIDWSIALKQGEQRASVEQRQLDDAERARFDQAFQVASLWLDEAVDVSSLPQGPELLTRRAWVAATMPVWTQVAEPVALSIADSLTKVMSEQAPEEMRSMIQGATGMLRGIGGTLFAMQLGQVVGQLATEVVSGGDIGIPLMEDGRASILPQNVAEFGADLEIASDQIELYLAVREIAHARLFRHARWLRLHLVTAITTYARGIGIDIEKLEELAEGFDPSNTDALRSAVENGALIKPRSDSQQAALDRLETMLALVEGWVDVVTADATTRLPGADRIAETIRRRRASGGPAESALATLVGLELRPRRLREAAAMWRAVTDAVGVAQRDALWAHPDLLPLAADLDDPAGLVARLTGTDAEVNSADDEFDQALEQLLRGETPAAPGEDGEDPA